MLAKVSQGHNAMLDSISKGNASQKAMLATSLYQSQCHANLKAVIAINYDHKAI